jgi:hypothetical protein
MSQHASDVAQHYPRIVISIASGATPKVRAKPFFASAIVRGVTFGAGRAAVGAAGFASLGIGFHFSVDGSMPTS